MHDFRLVLNGFEDFEVLEVTTYIHGGWVRVIMNRQNGDSDFLLPIEELLIVASA